MATLEACLAKFVWHDLMTKDVNAAAEFYEQLLPEWSYEQMPMEGGDYHMIKCGARGIGGMVSFAEAPPEVPSHWIGYVAVENCDEAIKTMEAAGGKLCVPAIDVPGVGRFAVVTDPQGAVIKPFQLAEPMEMPRPQPGDFCWDEVMVNDVDAAKKFYSAAFDWGTSEMDMGPAGMYTLFTQGELQVAGAMAIPDGQNVPPHWMSHIMVNDLAARFEKAKQLGATPILDVTDVPNIGQFTIQLDPTGAAFALFQPADHLMES